MAEFQDLDADMESDLDTPHYEREAIPVIEEPYDPSEHNLSLVDPDKPDDPQDQRAPARTDPDEPQSDEVVDP